MLTRPQLLLIIGSLLLSAAFLIAVITRRLRRGHHPSGGTRLRMDRSALMLLQRCLTLPPDTTGLTALHDMGRGLTEALLTLRRALRTLPSLPEEDGEPRLMPLARRIVLQPPVTSGRIARELAAWDADAPTENERTALPHCIAVAQCERLSLTLRTLLSDERDRRRAVSLAARMARATRPVALLDLKPLTTACLSSLLTLLRAQHQETLMEAVDEWLALHGSDAEHLAVRVMQRQMQLVEALRACTACFDALRLMNWPAAAEEDSPLHRLLLDDPAGMYPHMTLASRARLRLRAEQLARILRTSPQRLIAATLALCNEADPQSLERHAGYYLLDPTGTDALRRTLGGRHGRLRSFMQQHGTLPERLLFWGVSVAVAFPFLHTFHPLWLLPAFLIVAGSSARGLVARIKPAYAPPAMEISAITPELRTLVVLPATLSDPSDALRALKHLRTARHAFPADGIDCLLMADHAPCMTQRSSADAAIMSAASAGTAALCDDAAAGRFMYLQRARVFSPDMHAYAARGGSAGAEEAVCRLIAQGECEDLFDCASFSPSELHRRYAFVLLLDGRSLPAPGMLEALLAAAAHPLNTRWPEGARGFSCFRPVTRPPLPDDAGIRLIRPDAYLESLDGRLRPGEPDGGRFLTGLLCGSCIVPDASSISDEQSALSPPPDQAYARTHACWQLLRWLAPWVSSPDGLLRNPLSPEARFHLRERLREHLVPLYQCLLLIYSLLSRDLPLMLIALLAPELGRLLSGRRVILLPALSRSVLLPLHAGTAALGIVQALPALVGRRRPPLAPAVSWPSAEMWLQGCAALLCFVLGVVRPPLWLPALIPAGLFAAFPLIHAHEARALAPAAQLSPEDAPLLRQYAAATWEFFRKTSAGVQPVPPARRQSDPPHSAPEELTPESVALYLTAVVCAKELSLCSAAEAGLRIRHAADLLERLPMPGGLPCRRYTLDGLRIADPAVDASSCGLLLASLMTSAQALRTWLPELPGEEHDLPARLDHIARNLDIRRLFDPDAELFYRGLDGDGRPEGHILHFADQGLVLSLAAAARGLIPPGHFARLSRTCTEAAGLPVPLSRRGDLAAYLLPGLFMPLVQRDMERVVNLHQIRGMRGLWGLSASAEHAFTPDLAYRRRTFGLQSVSALAALEQPVFAPYAAALALSVAPDAAMSCLRAMQRAGCLTPTGFFDAIDCASGDAAVVRMQDAFHQGVLLCAAAHVLADAPLQRYFCAIPAVSACLSLLRAQGGEPLILPQRPVHPPQSAPHSMPDRQADASHLPLDAHLLGSAEASLAVNASGSSLMTLNGLPLTRFTGAPTAVEGMQLYLVVGEKAFRLTDPRLPGETVFSAGSVRFDRRCGSLRTSLTLLHDPAGQRFLHLLEVTNLAAADRVIELAGCLLPDLSADAEVLEAARPTPHHLTLRDRRTGTTLHHQLALSAPAQQLTVCTDERAFLGRGRTLADPASLEEPMVDLISGTGCLSFRVRVAIGGRAQLRLLLTTGLTDAPVPEWHELPGLQSLASLHAQAVSEAIPLSPDAELTASRMTGALLWRSQPHQGAASPVAAHALPAVFAAPGQPLLTLTVPDESALPRLRECLAAASWFTLHGCPLTTCILCTSETHPLAEECVSACHPAIRELDSAHVLSDISPAAEEAILAASRLVLHGDGRSITAQLDALSSPMPVDGKSAVPPPGDMPELPLLYPGGYGGFDPDSGDYIVLLQPRQTTPVPWPVRHSGDGFSFTADETGLRKPFHERLLIAIDGGASFDPLNGALPRSMRVGCGVTRWRVHGDSFRLTLSAGCIPGCSAGLRTLHIRSLINEPMTISVTVTASLAASPLCCLTALEGTVLSEGESPAPFLAAAEGDWAADVVPEMHHAASGRAASLKITLTIPGHASADAAWLAGTLRSPEELPGVQRLVRETGVSAVFRETLQAQSAALDRVTISTPEPTLDLLVNHVLPRQLLSAGLPLHAPEAPEPPVSSTASDSLDLDEQSLAAIARGDTPRTRKRLLACWDALYDRERGLIRRQLPGDAPQRPGTPENGGQVTRSAVMYLAALLRAGLTDHAWELLRALNPIHHCDDPLRSEAYCAPPWQLSDGLHASGEARATPDDTAADWLLTVILRMMLGLNRAEDMITLAPHVPADWDSCTITLQHGASTWRIELDHDVTGVVIDGRDAKEDSFRLTDDGRIHHIRWPLN